MARYSFGPDPSYQWGGGGAADMGRNLLNGLTNGMNISHAMAAYNREQNTLGWDIARQNAQNRANAYGAHNLGNAQLLAGQVEHQQFPWLPSVDQQFGDPYYSHPGATMRMDPTTYGRHYSESVTPLPTAPPLSPAPQPAPLPASVPYHPASAFNAAAVMHTRAQPDMGYGWPAPSPATHQDFLDALAPHFGPMQAGPVSRPDNPTDDTLGSLPPWMSGSY